MYKELKQNFNDNQRKLRPLLKKKSTFLEAQELCLTQHSLVHSSLLKNKETTTLFDLVIENINQDCFRNLQDKDKRTIIFHIWHCTRIEDITVNILINNSKQVINSDNWSKKLGTQFADTGNSMTSEQILKLSQELNIEQLLNYRLEVAKVTQNTIKKLKQEDLKQTFTEDQKNRIISEGAVLSHEKAIWLIDFWGKKNVAGILLMPVTRHHVLHINASMHLLTKCNKYIAKKL